MHDTESTGPAAAVDQPAQWPVLAVVSVGGALGAVGRYGADLLLPAADRGFPVGTLLVNVTGCLLIGVLAGVLFGADSHRLLRPFVGVGLLGGFTTFSTYSVGISTLALDGAVGTAFGYLLATVAAALVAVEVGMTVSRWSSYRGAPSYRRAGAPSYRRAGAPSYRDGGEPQVRDRATWWSSVRRAGRR